MLVDSHGGTRQGLIHRLEQMPAISVVGAASDEDEALKVIGRRRPDVVVIDHRHISTNGAEFLHRLAALDPRVGIVVLTAFLTEKERVNLSRAGAQAILYKEIDSGSLVKTIRRVAARGLSKGAGGAPGR